MRLNLARALMCRSDILLLDEPTNHLDLPAILWLERWLKRYDGILLVISHDRDFLDEVCTRIVQKIIDGFSAEARAARLLHGLGFADDSIHTTVREFSGGWRMRLNLARALMCRSDILLLDEPTNHLDLPAILWLERWLKRYDGILLVISHDRDFLDEVCTRIAHIEYNEINLFSGNYSMFEAQRAEQLAQQQAMYARQQTQIKHIQSYVDRFRYKASIARDAGPAAVEAAFC